MYVCFGVFCHYNTEVPLDSLFEVYIILLLHTSGKVFLAKFIIVMLLPPSLIMHHIGDKLLLHVNWFVRNPHYRIPLQLCVLPFTEAHWSPHVQALWENHSCKTINDGQFTSQPYIPANQPYGPIPAPQSTQLVIYTYICTSRWTKCTIYHYICSPIILLSALPYTMSSHKGTCIDYCMLLWKKISLCVCTASTFLMLP